MTRWRQSLNQKPKACRDFENTHRRIKPPQVDELGEAGGDDENEGTHRAELRSSSSAPAIEGFVVQDLKPFRRRFSRNGRSSEQRALNGWESKKRPCSV